MLLCEFSNCELQGAGAEPRGAAAPRKGGEPGPARARRRAGAAESQVRDPVVSAPATAHRDEAATRTLLAARSAIFSGAELKII